LAIQNIEDTTMNVTYQADGNTKEETATLIEGTKKCPSVLGCCNNELMLLQVDDATGFQLMRMANGMVIMSNIFLSTALITLAKRDIGCEDEDENCEGSVYGFKPSSLITLIATVTGVLSAFFLPIMGAIVDYTKYRKTLGMVTTFTLVLIQGIQIGTVQQTWFVMSILQAFNGFLYQVVTLCAYSYLPEISRAVGEKVMTVYSGRFYQFMFGFESFYLIVIIGLSLVIGLDSVATGQLGQGIDVVGSGFFYALAWYFYTHQEPKQVLSEGQSLISAGFQQVFTTTKGIFSHYPTTIGWFYLGVVFSEAAVNSFTTVAVTYLAEVVNFDATYTGIVFLIVLVSTIPGSIFASWLMKKTASPPLCMKLCLLTFIIINFVAFLTLTGPEVANLTWLYAVCWGLVMGWFYPTELNLYSHLMPKGQEAELAGFFLYCTQILGWLPPLIFTIMNENGVSLSWGGIHLNAYMLLGAGCYQMMPSWSSCLAIVREENKILSNKDSTIEVA